ncbi:MAG: dipeptide epimerase [Rhodobacteraceae bacterium]|nr:dipeptide epimerase [Paracoccaceae bacterium]
MGPHLSARAESFALARAFIISRGSKTAAEVVTAHAEADGVTGRGECVPYARYGESVESVCAQIDGLPAGLDRAALQEALPPGAARNAADCALWDLEAKRAGRRVWELAGLAAPGPVTTAFTLSLEAPEAMAEAARQAAHLPLLKIKLGTPEDLVRLEAVRAAAPGPRIIVDANEGWSAEDYTRLAPDLVRLGVVLVEQPLPAGQDEPLAGLPRPVPLCADESCHDRATLGALKGRYDVINIKLDKTGGLTEALALREAARSEGFGVMVGCMVGTSLAMAPAVLLAQGAEVVDLDGPMLLSEDRDEALRYEGAEIAPPDPKLWG